MSHVHVHTCVCVCVCVCVHCVCTSYMHIVCVHALGGAPSSNRQHTAQHVPHSLLNHSLAADISV